ncbi:hypothetical protein M231_05871 [Tremella mesenterica]|uniref:BRCT domain-containing protein n=1 Tax=Tremella mesenterica TaxID=5217 RepID=A0A4V1M3H6_TREME|nr:hypothetical protein M231_05871 [Tremella mesenterica]
MSPLTPTSSQEIILLSPPQASSSTLTATALPKPVAFQPSPELKTKIVRHIKDDKSLPLKPEKRSRMISDDREREAKMARSRQTERMMTTLGKSNNPITNSDLYSRTEHFVSCATGHQQSNRGGGSAGAATYWEVRNAKMAEQVREKKTSILAGCVMYINGSTGPKVSNLQLQHLITQNGGRFVPLQSSSCTHIIAGNLSGTKAQKHINGQGGRGASRRAKVVRVDWVLDSIDKGMKVSEAGYSVIHDPSQTNLFNAFGTRPKAENLDT